MFRVAPHIEGVFADCGFMVNLFKSKKLEGREIEGLPESPDGFTVERDGFIALEVPVGGYNYLERISEKLIGDMEPPLEDSNTTHFRMHQSATSISPQELPHSPQADVTRK